MAELGMMLIFRCGDYCVGLEIGALVKCSSSRLGGSGLWEAATESEKGKNMIVNAPLFCAALTWHRKARVSVKMTTLSVVIRA